MLAIKGEKLLPAKTLNPWYSWSLKYHGRHLTWIEHKRYEPLENSEWVARGVNGVQERGKVCHFSRGRFRVGAVLPTECSEWGGRECRREKAMSSVLEAGGWLAGEITHCCTFHQPFLCASGMEKLSAFLSSQSNQLLAKRPEVSLIRHTCKRSKSMKRQRRSPWRWFWLKEDGGP